MCDPDLNYDTDDGYNDLSQNLNRVVRSSMLMYQDQND